MRLHDLLHFVHLAAAPYRLAIGDIERLGMIKEAFPRPDLIAWFDSQVPDGLKPEHYFLLLICCFAWRAQPRIAYRQLVLCGGDGALVTTHAGLIAMDARRHVWCVDRDGALPKNAEMPPLHEVGMVIGVFERAEQIAALQECLALNFYHAARLMILNDEAAAALDATTGIARPVGGSHNVFDGPLMQWGAARWRAVYLISEPAERG